MGKGGVGGAVAGLIGLIALSLRSFNMFRIVAGSEGCFQELITFCAFILS